MSRFFTRFKNVQKMSKNQPFMVSIFIVTYFQILKIFVTDKLSMLIFLRFFNDFSEILKIGHF